MSNLSCVSVALAALVVSSSAYAEESLQKQDSENCTFDFVRSNLISNNSEAIATCTQQSLEELVHHFYYPAEKEMLQELIQNLYSTEFAKVKTLSGGWGAS